MWQVINQFDVAVWQFIQLHQDPSLVWFFSIFTELGNPLVWMMVAAVLFWKGKESHAFWLSLGLLLNSAVVGGVKGVAGRVRPIGGEQGLLSFFNDSIQDSFPSGHASTAATGAYFLKQGLPFRWQVAGWLLVLLVAFSRVYLGAHFVSDVLIGLLIGIMVGKVCFELWQKSKNHSLFQLSQRVEIILLLIIGLLLEFFFQEWKLFLYFVGFFLGMIAWSKYAPRTPSQAPWIKVVGGVMGLAVILLGYLVFKSTGFASLFVIFGGLFASFLYPLLWQTLIRGQRA